MKKYVLILTVAVLSGYGSHAQFLKRLKARAEDAVSNTIAKKAAKAMHDSTATSPAGAATAPGTPPANTQGTLPAAPLKSYSHFDFVPGDSILYAEDFAQDVIG